MLQTISPVDLRQQAGSILDKVNYRQDRYLVSRKNKPLAVLVSYDEYQRYFTDKFGEVYTKQRIKNFRKEDRMTAKQEKNYQEILQMVKK